MRAASRLVGLLVVGVVVAFPATPVEARGGPPPGVPGGVISRTAQGVGDLVGDVVEQTTAGVGGPAARAGGDVGQAIRNVTRRVGPPPGVGNGRGDGGGAAAPSAAAVPAAVDRAARTLTGTGNGDGGATRRRSGGGGATASSSGGTARSAAVSALAEAEPAVSRGVPRPRSADRREEPAPLALTGVTAEGARPPLAARSDGLAGDARRFALPLIVALGVLGYLLLSRDRAEEDRLRPDALRTSRAMEFG